MLSSPILLAADHQLDDFACGVDSLDDWLKKRAYPNQLSGASRTYVVSAEEKVVGYYCLASGALELNDAPSQVRCNMPNPIPVAILGRLAVVSLFRKKGLAWLCFKTPPSAPPKQPGFLAYAVFLSMRFQLKPRLSMNIMALSLHRHNQRP